MQNAIQQRIQKPADIVYYTNNQQDADKKANQIAKSDNADYILKQTTTTTNTNSNDGKIINNYCGVHAEKDNSLAVGVTEINGIGYASVEYTHKNISVEIHSKDLRNIDGVSVKKIIKKW